MSKKQMLILIPLGVLAFLVFSKKTFASKTPETAKSQSLAEPLTGLIGTGIGLVSNLVNKGIDFFSPNQTAYVPTGSVDIGAMFSPSDLSASDVTGYFGSIPADVGFW